MKCIDAIEGTVKCILNRIHEVSLEDRMDDSEYVRSVKAVIDATDDFVEGNQEIVPDPNLLKNVLYSYSKELWRTAAGTAPRAGSGPAAGGVVTGKDAAAKGAVAKSAVAKSAAAKSAAGKHPVAKHGANAAGKGPDEDTGENDGYREYYFDYLYRHGVYPR
jgi:hypothetical protein